MLGVIDARRWLRWWPVCKDRCLRKFRSFRTHMDWILEEVRDPDRPGAQAFERTPSRLRCQGLVVDGDENLVILERAVRPLWKLTWAYSPELGPLRNGFNSDQRIRNRLCAVP